ncbi:helix-turn-helix domain-containing protein [Streptomyces sp. ET3-23]|uniref:helix-turn-helix domain-containing protein n=1 Tax=Streptomyces sp. ET3-23 TaxID=2885643 RepID=UPI001D100B1C|nr:helix-turn-helix transcriptional regulator [Streptomyces sp. ET3-23]MCC2275976.1 helix-turn-helix domain-containing protein [Streptomyces sp. ET3-23]
MSTEQRKQFGAYIARLRHEARLSQRQLADRLCTLSGLSTLTRNEVSRWERGGRVPNSWLPTLSRALGVPPDDLERAARYARGETLPVETLSPVETLRQLLPPDDLLLPLESGGGRRIGRESAKILADRAHGLRLADDVLAGSDLLAPAFRELSAAVRLFRESSHSEEVGRALLVQIGEIAQIAGWIASDAGQHGRAEQAYRLGISAAREARDFTLVGNLAGSLAYQWSNTGREREGVALANAALAEAGPRAHPRAQAVFFDRLAWAHTRAGEAQPAMHALEQAHEALVNVEAEEAPSWAYWVCEDELRVMDARVYTELRRPLRAVPLLSDVLDRYDTTHAREVALYRSWLVVALADANEPEQAADEARRILSAGVASERTAERSRVILRRLKPFSAVPEVDSLMSDYGHVLAW